MIPPPPLLPAAPACLQVRCRDRLVMDGSFHYSILDRPESLLPPGASLQGAGRGGGCYIHDYLSSEGEARNIHD